MKAQELRIGNFIMFSDDGTIFTVGSIEENGYTVQNEEGTTWIEAEEFEPILLTEEWLIKFGFSKRDNSVSFSYYIGGNEITHDWLFDLTWLEKPERIGAPNAPFYRNGRHTIFYVHQLQNLYFALTGEELTLKENNDGN